MDIEELRWFVVIAHHENITKASAELNTTPSTLSRVLARIEREVGATLFERRSGRLQLNASGQIFLAEAQRAYDDLRSTKQRIATLLDPTHGEIRIAFARPFGPWIARELILPFSRVAPSIRFSLASSARARLPDDFDTGVVDAVFTTRRPVDPVLSWFPVYREPLFLAVSPTHRLADRSAILLEEAASEAFIMGIAGGSEGLRELTDQLCRRAGFVPEVRFDNVDRNTARSLASVGLGVAITPKAHGDRQPVDIVYIPLDDAGSFRDYGMIASTRSASALASQFCEFVRARISRR